MSANKAFPSIEIELGGESLELVCNYRTIFNYEKIKGEPLSSVLSNPANLGSINTIATFIYSCIQGKKKHYSLDWVLENLNPNLIQKMIREHLPACINAAFLDDEEVEQEKKDEKTENPQAKK